MRTAIGCSHCHALAWTDGPTWPDCPSCGHRADRARVFCDCDRCLAPPTPTPLAALRESVRRRVFVDGDPEAV